MAELVEVMRRLLAPDGCPWDREQTLETLRPFLLEETYEVLEALDQGSPAEHCEELGDLLMQIVFQSALRQAEGAFTIEDVIAGVTEKLIRRHPHVFADAKVASSGEVLAQWEEIKADEKKKAGAAKKSLLEGVPVALPALSRAQALTAKASRVGFDWPEVDGPLAKLEEELGEMHQARQTGDAAALEAEIGDVLFAVVNVARKLGCDAEAALRGANQRFARRFGYIEDRLAESGRTPGDASLGEMDALWDEAKESLGASINPEREEKN